MSDQQPADLDLLAMRAEGLVDRSIGAHFDRTTTMEERLGVSSIVPTELLKDLGEGPTPVRPPPDPLDVPPRLRECETRLVAAGWRVRVSAPSLVYVIPRGVAFASSVTKYRSDSPLPSWLRGANPGNWEAVEWDELLDGELGPWAMATRDRRVVSLTHCPTPLTKDSVEAGAWTDPEYRGRGYGAATTAQWAEVLAASGRVLFYSTHPDNHSSQRLAERLGLRFIGHQWLLHNEDLRDDQSAHPLSRLRKPRRPTTSAIETDRLRLESMNTAFLRAVLAGDRAQAQRQIDARVPPHFSLFDKLPAVARRLRLIETDPTQHPWMYRAIIRKEDRELLGHISFHHKAPDPDLRPYGETGAELGYVIEPAHRRRGYAKESAIGMMQWAAQQFGVRSFVLTISPRNTASLKLAESMGFSVIGEHQDPVDGLELVMRGQIERILACKRGPPASSAP